MKSFKYILFLIVLLGFVVNGCQKPERDNPWDELAKLNLDAWAPKQLQVQRQDLLNNSLNWTFEDYNIQGFCIDRKVGEEAWQEAYVKLPKTARSWQDSLISPDTALTYQYRVYAYAGNNKSANEERSFRPIFEAPSNLLVEKVNDISYQLSWENNTLWPEKSEQLQGFKIDRQTGEGNWETAVVTLLSTQTSWIDTNVFAGRESIALNYRIYSFYGECKSAPLLSTNEISLSQPSDFIFTRNSLTSIALSWQNNNQGAQGFILERSYDEQNWEQLQKNALTSYTDEDFELNRMVYYRLAHFYEDYISDYDVVSFDSQIPVPQVFESMMNSNSSITLSWQYPYTGHEGYFLERRTNDGQWEALGSFFLPEQYDHTDDQINLQQNYYTYRLSAFVGINYSDFATLSMSLPNLTTAAVYNILAYSAFSGGEVINQGDLEVTGRGVVWSTEAMPSLESNEGFTVDGTGTGTYTSTITGLNALTNYYVRAYATNTVGVTYGDQKMFTTTNYNTILIEVINPATGKTWMDRNMGASRAATSCNDDQAYGDLYQWGRLTDGHEKRNSGTTSTVSSTDVPGHSNFITNSNPSDWRSPQNDNLWQGVNGINNPCPPGFRLPTIAEFDAESQSWESGDTTGAISSPLKLTAGGYRNNFGSFSYVGSSGYYWTSSLDGLPLNLKFDSGIISVSVQLRVRGLSVRCIKD